MNLPEGIRHAVHMGASEALLEWTCDPTEDGLDTLGASYQSIGDGAVSDADAARYLADLAAWDDAGPAGPAAARLEAVMCKAGVELARGLIAEAANIGTVPARVKPYLTELAPLVVALKDALAGGQVDEDWLQETIWG